MISNKIQFWKNGLRKRMWTFLNLSKLTCENSFSSLNWHFSFSALSISKNKKKSADINTFHGKSEAEISQHSYR